MEKKAISNGLLLLLFFAVISCTTAKSQSRDKKNKEYEEDISSIRPKYDSAQKAKEGEAQPKVDLAVVPANDITKRLNTRLDSLEKMSSGVKNSNGFRILVYSGRSSKEVQEAKTKVYQNLPQTSIYIDFKSPNQRVKVGDCLDRIEAYSLYGKLKKHFPNAVIIPDNVTVK
jgi:hypothetical protein